MKTKIVQVFGTDAKIEMYEAKKAHITIGENWYPDSWYPTRYPVPKISFTFGAFTFVYIDLIFKYNQRMGWHTDYMYNMVCAEKDPIGYWTSTKPDDNTKRNITNTLIDVLKKEITVQDMLEAEEAKFQVRLKWASNDVKKHKTRMEKALETEAKINKKWAEAKDKLQKYLAQSPIPQSVAPVQISSQSNP